MRAAGLSTAVGRAGGALCVTAGLLLSGCESLHPNVVKGYTLEEGVAPGPEAAAPAEPLGPEPEPAREPRTEDFYSPGTGVFVGTPGPGPPSPGEGNITLNFENTNLREVVKVILGDLLEGNYTIDPAVQGSVTLQTSRPLSRDALIPTLEMLLRMNGAALVDEGGIYNVVPRDAAVRGLVSPQLGDSGLALPQGYSVRIVPLEHIAAQEMQKILEPFAVSGNIVRVDSARNLIILAGSGPELARLLETVQIFDVDWLEGMSVGLFTPDFVDAETLAKELKIIFGEEREEGSPLSGLVQFVTLERLNALLVITARPNLLEKVDEWVSRLDRESGGAGTRLFVYYVQNGKASELAEVLNQVFREEERGLPPAELAPGLEPARIASPEQLAEAPPPEGAPPEGAPEPPGPLPVSAPGAVGEGLAVSDGAPIRIIADEVNNALLIMATAQQYREVEAALKRLDITPLQVLIEATIAEITLNGALQYGLEWFFKNKLINTDSKTGVGQLDLGEAGLSAIVPGFSYAITDSAGAVRAVLNALAEDSRLNVISSPSLMVLNNQTASIQVGDEVPVTTQQQQSVVGESNVVNSIEFRNTGVLLSVTPRVNAGGLVIMDLEQEVSQVAEETESGSLTPTIQQRKITSTVAIQSGQTVVLGGLIREQRSQSRSGIPGLYNLPILGPLFGTRSDDQQRTELVVLITPRAVRDAADAARVTEEFRSKMKSLRPLTPPDAEETPGERKDKSTWPRVGPEVPEEEPIELTPESPPEVSDAAPPPSPPAMRLETRINGRPRSAPAVGGARPPAVEPAGLRKASLSLTRELSDTAPGDE